MATKITIAKQDFGFVMSAWEYDRIKIVRYKDIYYCHSQRCTYDEMVVYLKRHFNDDAHVPHLHALETLKTTYIGGFDIHLNNDYALYWACLEKNVPLMKLLIKNGADVSADHNEILQLAVRTNNVESVRLLLSHGADPEEYARGNKDYGNALTCYRPLIEDKKILVLLKRAVARKTILYWIKLTPIFEIVSFKKLTNVALYLVVFIAATIYIINEITGGI